MNIYIKFFIILILIFPAFKLEASNLFFDPNSIELNKDLDFKIDLFIDAENENINTIGGELVIPNNFNVKNILYGDSIITFWVEKPELKDGKIHFAGIIPGGFKAKVRSSGFAPGRVLTLILSSKDEKNKTIDLKDMEIYLNDGLGTLDDSITAGNFSYTFNSSINESFQAFTDAIPPEEFEIELFDQDGENFLVFDTQDKESGVKYYEIKIGIGRWKIVKSPFKIDEMELTQEIQVKAVDNFGNVTISQYGKQEESSKTLLIIVSVISLIILIPIIVILRKIIIFFKS